MNQSITKLYQACLALLISIFLVGCDEQDKVRSVAGEQMTSEGITITGAASDDHLSDYDPAFIDAYNAALSKEDYSLAERLAAKLVSKRTNDANAVVAVGLPQLMQGRFEDAAASFDKAIALEPTNSTALYNRGFAAWQLGDSATAMKFYRLALEIDPDLPDAHFGMAAASEKLGLHDLVVKHASRFLELKSEGAFVSEARVMVLSANKKIEEKR